MEGILAFCLKSGWLHWEQKGATQGGLITHRVTLVDELLNCTSVLSSEK